MRTEITDSEARGARFCVHGSKYTIFELKYNFHKPNFPHFFPYYVDNCKEYI